MSEEKDSLGDRMKAYEDVWRFAFPARLPVIVRVDGRAFHSLTRGMEKPFDPRFIGAMESAMHALCAEMQGALLGYVQSDEISILLYPWLQRDSQAWFGNNLQKIVSLSASCASLEFSERIGQQGEFDARAFVLPDISEVCNYFIWRQKDWARNSVQMLARAHFSQKQLHGKGIPEIHEMLYGVGVNWADLDPHLKNGSAYRLGLFSPAPVFTQDRAFILGLIVEAEARALLSSVPA